MRFTNAISIGLIIFSQSALPCSYVQLGNPQDRTSAQNFDFFPDSYNGITVNKRNMEKSAGEFAGLPVNAPPAKWVSKYGSITFGYGREVPVTGVNEVGLTIHRFVFMNAKYPAQNNLPAIKETQYVQYILDTAKDINDVINQTRAVQIFPEAVPTHFAVCDANAQCAVIEAENGQLNIYSGADIKVEALTNTSYPAALEAWANCPNADCITLDNSKWRFITAANFIKNFSGGDVTQATFDILNTVKQVQGFTTIWTVLSHWGASESKFYLKNTKSSNTVLTLDIKNQDYSCKSPVKVAMIYSEDMGSSIQLVDYSRRFQETLTEAEGKLNVPKEEQLKHIEYPDKYTRCLE